MSKSLILAKYEVDIIKQNIESSQMQLRAISVLNYMKKYIIKNNGYFKISIRELNRSYKRTNFKFSDDVMRRIIKKLIEINLLIIDNSQKGTVYCLPKNEINKK